MLFTHKKSDLIVKLLSERRPRGLAHIPFGHQFVCLSDFRILFCRLFMLFSTRRTRWSALAISAVFTTATLIRWRITCRRITVWVS